MRGRVIILIGAIVLLAVLAVVFLMAGGGGDDEGAEETPVVGDVGAEELGGIQFIETVQIVVAIQDLPRGIVIPQDGVGIQDWPVDALPEPGNYFKADQISDVVGRIARTDIPRGAPVLGTERSQLPTDGFSVLTDGVDRPLLLGYGRRPR